MKKRFITIIFCLVLSVLSYSQIELIDKNNDTLVCITYSQMDKIYVELLQKDSLLEQAKIRRFKELKYIQIIDSARKDINTLKTYSNDLESDYSELLLVNEKKHQKIIRQRKVGLIMLGVIILQALL